MISFEPLWETMHEKHVTQYRLIHYYKVSAGQIHRLKKNQYASTHTIETLCTILDCPVEKIIRFIPELPESEKPQAESRPQKAKKSKQTKKG